MESAPTGLAPSTGLADTMAEFPEVATGTLAPDHVFPTGHLRFDLGDVLGRGGMGTVYIARDAQFGREVALKEMSSEVLTVEATRRFLVEALVTANLEHPGIPAVYERGVRAGRPFYAMRKVGGRTLAQAVDETRDFDERLRLLPSVVQVAHTLGFAHERGVVHRDVKPDNVILGDHGETVLLDWGIARVEGARWTGDERDAPELQGAATVAGAVMGTPAYMAPEQAAGRVDRIDERTDVFALGAMLYHVLSGAPPYSGPTGLAVLAAALEGQRVPLKRIAPKVSPELSEIVDVAMAMEPVDRYPNAAAFAETLQAFLTSAVTERPSRLVRALANASGVFVLLLTLATVLLLGSQVSSIRSQGIGAIVDYGLAAIGSLLALIEWRTKGRHRLSPLILAMTGITLLAGLIGTVAGVGLVAHATADLPAAEMPVTFLWGLWEACGNLPTSASLAAVQLVLWALARRATQLAHEADE